MGVNPIKTVYYYSSVSGFTYTASSVFDSVPCPSSFEYGLADISEDDAGRTEDMTMNKKRKGQAITIKLAWQNVPTSIASTVLQIFNEEYIVAEYLDPMVGAFVKKEFYVGNRTAPLYNASMGVWKNISFDLVERQGGFVFDPNKTYSSGGTTYTGAWVDCTDQTIYYGKNGVTVTISNS